MNLRTILQAAVVQLSPISSTPALDAQLLLAHVLGLNRAQLMAMDYQSQLARIDLEKYIQALNKRVNGYPVAYILGYKEFYGRNFVVDERVLIPRADTEILVEEVVNYFNKNHQMQRVREVGFGSGAISLTLACELEGAQISASDISQHAYEVFEINYQKLKAELRSEVSFFVADLWLDAKPADILVSNLPYLTTQECQERKQARWQEPMLALNGELQKGDGGLGLINKLIEQASGRVGAIFLEASDEQMQRIWKMLESKGFIDIKIKKDLAGQQRVIMGVCSKESNK